MSKTNVYQIVTDRIIKQLEKGVIPWRKPWQGIQGGSYNRISKKPYSVLNQMILKHNGEYATFKQWQSVGGKIKKGAKSEIVVFWKILEKEVVNADGEKEKQTIPMLRYYNVFHISDVENVKPLEREPIEHEPIKEAEKIAMEYVAREKIKLNVKVSNEAFYNPLFDSVTVPKLEQYENKAEYYSTLYHELTHSTGHKKRLDRLTTNTDRTGYAKEELIAEIGSAYSMNKLNIENDKAFTNSVAYLNGWLQALKNDNKLIVSASSKAEKAVKLIFNEK